MKELNEIVQVDSLVSTFLKLKTLNPKLFFSQIFCRRILTWPVRSLFVLSWSHLLWILTCFALWILMCWSQGLLSLTLIGEIQIYRNPQISYFQNTDIIPETLDTITCVPTGSLRVAIPQGSLIQHSQSFLPLQRFLSQSAPSTHPVVQVSNLTLPYLYPPPPMLLILPPMDLSKVSTAHCHSWHCLWSGHRLCSQGWELFFP